MEEMIFNLADTHLFFNDLEVRNPSPKYCLFIGYNTIMDQRMCFVQCVWLDLQLQIHK